MPAPRRILVCRLNARLGNILFLTPLLRSLAATYPDACIDVLLRDPAHVALLENLPGVSRVMPLPTRLRRLPGFVRALRRRRYDLAVDPNIQSSGNRIAVALSGAHHRLGFAGHDQWLRLTHAAPRPRTERHQARQPLALLTEAIADLVPRLERNLGVRPGTAATCAAASLLHEAGVAFEGAARRPVVGFFAEATGPKRLPASWWRRWCQALRNADPGVAVVQIVPPSEDQAAIAAGVATIASRELDVLAAAIGRMDLFVAADSGPMHLATAAGVPVIGLFAATDPGQYAPAGEHCLALEKPLDAEAVAAVTRRHLAEVETAPV